MSFDSPKPEPTKNMKKFFIMIGVWLVAMISLIVGFHLNERSKAGEYDDTVIPYLNRIVPEISRWDLETTRGFMAEEALQNISDEQYAQIIVLFSKVGELQSFEEPEFEKTHTAELPSGSKTVVSYKVEAKYANGDARLNFKLIEDSGSYKVYLFNLSSEALGE